MWPWTWSADEWPNDVSSIRSWDNCHHERAPQLSDSVMFDLLSPAPSFDVMRQLSRVLGRAWNDLYIHRLRSQAHLSVRPQAFRWSPIRLTTAHLSTYNSFRLLFQTENTEGYHEVPTTTFTPHPATYFPREELQNSDNTPLTSVDASNATTFPPTTHNLSEVPETTTEEVDGHQGSYDYEYQTDYSDQLLLQPVNQNICGFKGPSVSRPWNF